MATQAGDEGLGLPGAERCMGAIPLSPWRPSGSLCQLGIGRRLVDKDQPRQCRIEEPFSPVDPQITGAGDLRPQLLGRLQTFFYGLAQACVKVGSPSSDRPKCRAPSTRRTIRSASDRRCRPIAGEPIPPVPSVCHHPDAPAWPEQAHRMLASGSPYCSQITNFENPESGKLQNALERYRDERPGDSLGCGQNRAQD